MLAMPKSSLSKHWCSIWHHQTIRNASLLTTTIVNNNHTTTSPPLPPPTTITDHNNNNVAMPCHQPNNHTPDSMAHQEFTQTAWLASTDNPMNHNQQQHDCPWKKPPPPRNSTSQPRTTMANHHHQQMTPSAPEGTQATMTTTTTHHPRMITQHGTTIHCPHAATTCVNEASMLGSQHILNSEFLRTVSFEMRQQTHLTCFGECRHDKSSRELQKPVLKLLPCANKEKLLKSLKIWNQYPRKTNFVLSHF